MARTVKSNEPSPLPVVGWREYVAFPEWGVDALLAKIDTGARTSALHVADIVDRADGIVLFDVVLSRKAPQRTIHVEAPKVRISRVRNSAGQLQSRPVVKARIRVAGVEKEIEVSLVERSNMLCRMLLGRTALSGSFLVDPGQAYLHGRLADRHSRLADLRKKSESA